MLDVRPFARHDRDGLTALANRHIAAALPGGAVPVSTLLSQMERDPRQFVIDPWVVDRCTYVGIEAERVVAAAHLKRYGAGTEVSDDYRDAAELTWLICDPAHVDAGRAVLETSTRHLGAWGARVWYADGSLPHLLYGVPDSWPHVQGLLREAGFDDADGQIDVVYAGDVARVPEPDPPPIAGLELRRVVGPFGTSFEAWMDGRRLGIFAVDDSHGLANAQLARWQMSRTTMSTRTIATRESAPGWCATAARGCDSAERPDSSRTPWSAGREDSNRWRARSR